LRTELNALCRMDIDKAIPCGLILNELVSNALKHAFPERTWRDPCWNLREKMKDQVRIVVQDNGRGFPDGSEPCAVVSALNWWKCSLRQLDGQHLHVPRGPDNTGTRYLITFGRT
jgi:two-component sensor histidine kinase